MTRVKAALRSVSYAWAAVIGAVVFFALNVAIQPAILSSANVAPMVAVASCFVLVSMAQVPALLSGGGGIDMSVGPLAGLVLIIVVNSGRTDVGSVTALALGLGVASGLLIGVLVALVRVPPIIATLGANLVYTGLALQLQPAPGGTAPSWLTALSGTVAGIPGMLFPLAIASAGWIALMRTAYRRNLFAVGGDARAAYTAGIEVSAIRVSAYVLSGVFAAVAGLAFVAVLGSADANAAPPYTLVSLAGAALGGVALSGGRGGMLGAAAGGAIMFLIQNLLGLAQVSIFAIQVVFGTVLIVALALNSLTGRYREWRRAGGGVVVT